MAAERKNKGRQKIQMEKMSKESNLLVTFSKRRAGLFKKASELSTLCGAEVGIIVFSPGKKVFSFGHPSVDTVIDRFMTRETMSNSGAANSILEAHRSAKIRNLNLQLTQVLGQVEAEKKRAEMLNQMKRFASQMKYWWEGPVEELDLDQLEQLKGALEDLEKKSKKQADKLLIDGLSTNGQHYGYGARRDFL